jgi:hypothetical protein
MRTKEVSFFDPIFSFQKKHSGIWCCPFSYFTEKLGDYGSITKSSIDTDCSSTKTTKKDSACHSEEETRPGIVTLILIHTKAVAFLTLDSHFKRNTVVYGAVLLPISLRRWVIVEV